MRLLTIILLLLTLVGVSAQTSLQQESKVNFEKTANVFNIGFKPGLTFSSIDLSSPFIYPNESNPDLDIGIRLGVEGELFYGLQKNKWSVFIEPTYTRARVSTFKLGVVDNLVPAILDYSTIDLPIGIRHYLLLSEDRSSKLFINIIGGFDFLLNKTFIQNQGNDSLRPLFTPNWGFGFGYNQNKELSIEFRYYSIGAIVGGGILYDINVGSLIVGYKIISNK